MYKRILLNLKNWNCYIDKAKDRFLGDEDFYYKCLCEFTNDLNFEKLGQSILKGEYRGVFECAHSLKGVAANLGLTPIFDTSSKIVDLLRKDIPKDADTKLQEYYKELVLQKAYLLDILGYQKK